MYAIFVDGGRQYRVEAGQTLDLDYRSLPDGSELTLDRVLACSGKIGQPLVEGASVVASVVGVVQGPKLVVQKFRRRKNSRRKTGHRQMYTRVKIEQINA